MRLEYYNDLANSNGVRARATIVLRDGNIGTEYVLTPPSTAVTSNNNIANLRGGNVSQIN